MIIRGGVVACELGQHKNQMRLPRSFMGAAAPREILGSLVSAAPFIEICPVACISAVAGLGLERERFLEVSHLTHLYRLHSSLCPLCKLARALIGQVAADRLAIGEVPSTGQSAMFRSGAP